MYGLDVAILLMYDSHDMRHTGFRRLMVVNRPSGFGASQMERKREERRRRVGPTCRVGTVMLVLNNNFNIV